MIMNDVVYLKDVAKNISKETPMTLNLPIMINSFEDPVYKDCKIVYSNSDLVTLGQCRMEVIIVEEAPGKYQDYYYNEYHESWKILTSKEEKFNPEKNWILEEVGTACPTWLIKRSLPKYEDLRKKYFEE